jgi:hypothetical protein
MVWEAAAIPPKEPPMTTTSHSQTSWGSGRGVKIGKPPLLTVGLAGAAAGLDRGLTGELAAQAVKPIKIDRAIN